MTSFETCPLCGQPKGHVPGCPYGGRTVAQQSK